MTTQAEKVAAVVAYLKKNAPDIASLILKESPGVGDTHQQTALGNQKGSRKISFAEALAESKKPKKVKDDEPKVTTHKILDKALGVEEWSLPLDIVKAEPDQHLVFGWASVSTKNGQIIVDKQGDMILPEDLEKAAYDFVLYCRSQGDMHKTDGSDEPLQVGRLVESMMFTKEKQDILKINLGIEGWWVGFKVDDPAVWEAHKRNELKEFSIGGRGRRVEATI